MDFAQDDYAGWSAERLFSIIERLVAYDGALAARIYQLKEEQKNHDPSRAALAAGAVEVDSSTASLAGNPEFADVAEIVQV